MTMKLTVENVNVFLYYEGYQHRHEALMTTVVSVWAVKNVTVLGMSIVIVIQKDIDVLKGQRHSHFI